MAKNTRLRIKENDVFEVYHPETNVGQVVDGTGKKLSAILTEVAEAAKSHTDISIASLVDSAPETLDTLKEIATAIQATDGVVDGLISTIASKVSSADFTAHTGAVATTSVLGHVKAGTNIAVSAGTLSVANGSTSAKGVVQLTDGTSSESITTAATAKSVKDALDAAKTYADTKVSGVSSSITDSVTGTKYTWGVENGVVFLEGV